MTLKEIEDLINTGYEKRIILYRDKGDDVDIRGVVEWLIQEIKRLEEKYIDATESHRHMANEIFELKQENTELKKELLDEQTKVYWDDDKIKD